MASSLDKLSSNLKIDEFVNLKKYYSGNQLSLLLRKGVYPYDYVDCLQKLDETSHPPKEPFFGIRGTANKWFYSYIEKRKQFVTIDSVSSDTRIIKCGVPHGEILDTSCLFYMLITS